MSSTTKSITLNQANAMLNAIYDVLSDSTMTGPKIRQMISNLVNQISTDQVDGFELKDDYTTIVYSGYGGVNEQAVSLADANPGKVAIIDNTHVGAFLIDRASDLIDLLKESYRRDGTEADRAEVLPNAMLFEPVLPKVAWESGHGLWASTAGKFVSQIEGQVVALVPSAREHQIFAVIELPALLKNVAVTTINGMSPEEIEAASAKKVPDREEDSSRARRTRRGQARKSRER